LITFSRFRIPIFLVLVACELIIMLSGSLVLLSTLIATVAGVPVQTGHDLAAGDIDGILTVLDRVGTGIVKVDAEVKLWLGDLNNGIRILDDARWVHQDMSTGAKFIGDLPNGTIGVFDSLRIAFPMTSIMRSVDSYTTNLVGKKSFIGNLSLTSDFVTSLHDSSLAAEELSAAITTKLPDTMAWTVAPVKEVFTRRFEKTAKELRE
jgi:hypothetical protein